MSELIKREDAINAVEMFFKDAYIEDADIHCTDMVYEINHIPTAFPWRRVEEPPKEAGKYLIATKSRISGWIYETALYTKHLENAMMMVPVPKNTAGWCNWSEYNDCDVEVHPAYWMPIEPPKED